MVSTASTMQSLGSVAPDFTLANTHPAQGGPIVSLSDFDEHPALLVAFICNHCPYVVHIRNAVVQFAREFKPKGLGVIAISANDADQYPDDAPDKMAAEADRHGFGFPYLHDADQSVAKAYRAACTPDFFLFDAARQLVYRGQFDASRPKNDEAVTGSDLRGAVEATLAGLPVSDQQVPSIGCNIKWKTGQAPDYFPN